MYIKGIDRRCKKLNDKSRMKKSCLKFIFPIFVILISFIKMSLSSPVFASECNAPQVPSHVSAVSGPSGGEVTLYWDQSPGANRYAVAYGNSSGEYMYGADHIGEEPSRSYTVSSLTPGATYYFVLSAANGSCASGFSQEVKAVSGARTSSNPSMSSGSLQVIRTSNPDEVKLSWNEVSGATDYHVVYGKTAQVNEYGALNIGKQTHFTVGKLTPGVTYYFSIIPVKNGQAANPVGPVSVSNLDTVKNTQTQVVIITPQPTKSSAVNPVPTIKAQMPTKVPTQIPQVSSGPTYFIP